MSQLNEGAISTEEQNNLYSEVQSLAEDTEKQIKVIQGAGSDRLIEVYCLYSFFEFQKGKVDKGMEF